MRQRVCTVVAELVPHEVVFGTLSRTSPCESCARQTTGQLDAVLLCGVKTAMRLARGHARTSTPQSTAANIDIRRLVLSDQSVVAAAPIERE